MFTQSKRETHEERAFHECDEFKLNVYNDIRMVKLTVELVVIDQRKSIDPQSDRFEAEIVQ